MDSTGFLLNECQTPIEELHLKDKPKEIQDQFWDFFTNVPLIRWLTSADRPRAKDLPRDEEGKIIVDVTQPHILEDMDYFRPTAIHYQQTGRFTDLRPNPNPNSEYSKWVKEEVRRCWDGYVRPSDGEWITGDLYYFLNYFPILQSVGDETQESLESKITEQVKKKKTRGKRKTKRLSDFPRVWEGHYLKFHYIYQARESGHHGMELASRGKGKAHPYSQKVLTPDGWTTWDMIGIGSKLYGDDGNITTVVDIPYDEVSDIYEVTLIDGRKIRCTDGHLFTVKDHKKKRIRTLSLKEIQQDYICIRKQDSKNTRCREFNYKIPTNTLVNFENKQTNVDPYTLGVLIGDGCFRGKYKHQVIFTCQESDIETYKSKIPYSIKKVTSDNYSYALTLDTELLGDLWGLKSEDKYIPDEYKFNSEEIRKEILRGLFDTDGTVTFGTPIFTTTSERLKDDVLFIARSLGYNCSCSTKIPTYKGVECKRCWNIRIYTTEQLFYLKRKQDLVYRKQNKRVSGTSIVDIQYVGKERAKCVTVDNESRCYLIGDFVVTHNSYTGASLLSKRFNLGEDFEVRREVQCVVTAYERKYLTGANQILDMFKKNIDFIATNTEWPSKKLINSTQQLQWKMGYKDLDKDAEVGTLNSVIGITSKDDESKLRGSRGVLYLIEEMGSFPRLLGLYSTMRPSVEDGEDVFGLIYAYGTAGDEAGDFAAAQEIMYNPLGYNMLALKNVYDKEGQGKSLFTFFFPGYINRAGCYDKDGNSDVTKALLEIIEDRYTVKYNSSDVKTLTKRVAEIPITPQEAIMRTRGNLFPVTELTDRLNQIDNNSSEYDDVLIGKLVPDGEYMKFVPTTDIPIRHYPLQDNKNVGAIEIFKLPENDSSGKPMYGRYIVGHDPVDDDESHTMSLTSTFVLDLFTDQIVAEYTGRQGLADDNFEIVRRLCIFYNATCCYENNKKGLYAYFNQKRCLYLLTDTPEYLRDRDLVKEVGVGNKSKGVNATQPINNYANKLIREWLLKPYTTTKTLDKTDEDGKVTQQDYEVTELNLYRLRNRALIEELIAFNPIGNYDRIRALGMVMLYREKFMIDYEGDVAGNAKQDRHTPTIADDDFFKSLYDDRLPLMNNQKDFYNY